MPPLTLAAAQSHTLSTTAQTLTHLSRVATHAATVHVDLILFPEAFLGGYPRTCTFSAAIGSRTPAGRDQFLAYFRSAIDLGDTPRGGGDDWVSKRLPCAAGRDARGDGTREILEGIAARTGVFLVVGVIERAGGSLYCSVVYVCPRAGCVGKRRKVMPTGTERLVWAQGSPATLKAVVTVLKGVRVTLAAAVCWENYMPLLRQSLYAQNVNLYLAPTADAREAWVACMRTVGCEGRCFVVSANQCVRRGDLPEWITGDKGVTQGGGEVKAAGGAQRRKSVIRRTEDGHEISWPLSPSGRTDGSTGAVEEEDAFPGLNGDEGVRTDEPPATSQTLEKQDAASPSPEAKGQVGGEESADGNDFLSRGGSCIIGPLGDVLAGPLWEVQEDGEGSGLLIATVDFDDCERGRLDLDVAGSYSRNDAFELTVAGLDLNPPPV